MKKIININFHGRVIPIEETAFDILKQYVESLRTYFANEEGRDEIINDIESRFAELFSERLKSNVTCITDEDVNSIILSMGRPEDFEQDEFAQAGPAEKPGTGPAPQAAPAEEPRRLFRSENDKILGGVCGGLANYLRIDPAIIRIIFALITFGGFGSGILIYIVLWIVVPAKTLTTNIRKRLYRNSENRVFGGVASGLASYFHLEVWIFRLIFALPLIAGVLTSIFRRHWFDMDPGPFIITGGFGGTLFITYIILWIVLPEAVTASEKLEMRGEKVDLESIKNTFKSRAKDVGAEVNERVQQLSTQVKQSSQQFAQEVVPVMRRTGSGIGHAIGVLFKAFFLFIAGIFAFVLIMFVIGLLFSGMGFVPFKAYLLSGFWQGFLAWVSLILFLCVPVIALLTWLIRRIMGVRSRNNYLGYIFGTLWTLGLISFIVFISMVVNNFRSRASMEDDVSLAQPSTGNMIIRMMQGKVNYYGSDWFGFDWDNGDFPFYGLTGDSVMMTTVRVSLAKSPDASYHIHRVRFSHGSEPNMAKELAGAIQFEVEQKDSLLYLPQGFSITPAQKFRNQQVLMVVEVPVGKRVMVDRSVDGYHWFNIDISNRRRGWNVDWSDEYGDTFPWDSNVEYVMTETGLKRLGGDGENQDSNSQEDKEVPKEKKTYRYKVPIDSVDLKRKKDTVHQKHASEPVNPENKKEEATKAGGASAKKDVNPELSESLNSPLYILST